MKKLINYTKKFVWGLVITVLCYFILGVFQVFVAWVDMKGSLNHAELALSYEKLIIKYPKDERVPEYKEKAKEAWEKSDKLEKRSDFLMEYPLFKIHKWQ